MMNLRQGESREFTVQDHRYIARSVGPDTIEISDQLPDPQTGHPHKYGVLTQVQPVGRQRGYFLVPGERANSRVAEWAQAVTALVAEYWRKRALTPLPGPAAPIAPAPALPQTPVPIPQPVRKLTCVACGAVAFDAYTDPAWERVGGVWLHRPNAQHSVSAKGILQPYTPEQLAALRVAPATPPAPAESESAPDPAPVESPPAAPRPKRAYKRRTPAPPPPPPPAAPAPPDPPPPPAAPVTRKQARIRQEAVPRESVPADWLEIVAAAARWQRPWHQVRNLVYTGQLHAQKVENKGLGHRGGPRWIWLVDPAACTARWGPPPSAAPDPAPDPAVDPATEATPAATPTPPPAESAPAPAAPAATPESDPPTPIGVTYGWPGRKAAGRLLSEDLGLTPEDQAATIEALTTTYLGDTTQRVIADHLLWVTVLQLRNMVTLAQQQDQIARLTDSAARHETRIETLDTAVHVLEQFAADCTHWLETIRPILRSVADRLRMVDEAVAPAPPTSPAPARKPGWWQILTGDRP